MKLLPVLLVLFVLLLPGALGAVLTDNEKETDAAAIAIGQLGGVDRDAGQPIRYTGGACVGAVNIKMDTNNAGGPLTDVTVTIETNSSAAPSGTLVNGNATKTLALASVNDDAPTTFTFPANFTLSAGTWYWLRVSGTPSAANKYNLLWETNNVNGTMKFLDTTWQARTGKSAYFKVFGAAGACPAPAGTPVINSYTLHVENLYNNSNLSGVNVTFDTGCWNTTGADGEATVTNTSICDGLSGALSGVTAAKTGYYFNASTYSIAVNGTTEAGGYQGRVNVTSITRLVDGEVLLAGNDTWTVNTSGGKTYAECAATYPCLIYLKNGNNTLTLQSGNYYDKDFVVEITAPERTTTTVTGLYDALLFVNASNAYTGSLINNFTLNVSNSTHAYSATYPTTTGSVSVPAVQGLGFFLLADAENYALANYTIVPANSTPYYEFELWSNNSIRIYIFDEDTGAPLYSNVTIIVSGNATEDTYYTTAGEYFVTNLTDGLYTVKFQAANYTLKSYAVTVAERSTQILNAYLSASTNTVIFTCLDSLSSATIEGVSIGMYRLINSTLTLVESKSSDLTGRAQFTYSTGVKYSFVFTKTNYTTRAFSLDPVLFSSYDVYMEPTLSEFYDYNDVGAYYTPSQYFNDANHSFTFVINSPGGVLTNYNVTVRWPNGTFTRNGTNANGESLTGWVNITGAHFLDTVNVTYRYRTVFDDERETSRLHGIIGGQSNTIAENMRTTYGLSIFERILFATIMLIILAGVATLFTNATFGLFIGVLAMGIFSYIGFIPWLMTLLSVLVSFFLIAKAGGNY